MLPRADIITVNPVGRADPLASLETVGDARQQAFQRSLAGLLGKSMQGEVLSKLTDGSFIVKVAGASARMLLPPGVQVGADVPLTLVSISPRPTFQIGATEGGQPVQGFSEAGPALLPGPAGAAARAVPLAYAEGGAGAAATAPAARMSASHAAALLGKAPLLPADQLPAIDHESTPASLSAAARVITSVLGAALKSDNQSTSIISRTPLVAGPTVDPQRMAAALKDAIGKSGLFYESHVAEWSDGKRTLAELAVEPQMQRAAAPQGPEAGARQPAPPTDPVTAQLINAQLASQEQGKVSWQGQLWPGQQMQWEINKDAPDRHGADGDGAPEPGWRSGLRFRFPLLGEIAATVVLRGEQLHIQVQAGSADTAALLRAHAAALASRLEAAGTTLSSLTIGSGQAGGND